MLGSGANLRSSPRPSLRDSPLDDSCRDELGLSDDVAARPVQVALTLAATFAFDSSPRCLFCRALGRHATGRSGSGLASEQSGCKSISLLARCDECQGGSDCVEKAGVVKGLLQNIEETGLDRALSQIGIHLGRDEDHRQADLSLPQL